MTKTDFRAWPLMLCGPILRRVEPESVSVFVALKHSRNVELIVYGEGGKVAARGQMATLALGARLHVAVVTAKPKVSLPLVPGQNYFYDVKLTVNEIRAEEDTDCSDKTLASDGLAGPENLLQGWLALGYEPNKLPSFALPPTALKDLRLSHASCRKPHGLGRDALLILDTIIRQTYKSPIKRPHQLFLTGDQIYADDVAEPLLPELTEIGNLLLGWEEALPSRKMGGASPTKDELRPGARRRILCPPFTSSEAGSHLIRLGEFYAMYLFAWSDSLWPERFERKPKLEPLPLFNQSKKNTSSPDISTFNRQCDSIEHFRSGLGKVRRLLANVPIYMIFDDHEITDDWYVHRRQREEILHSPLGKRVVTNGLSAYCVFQGWGNQPQAFAPETTGGDFLGCLSQWRGGNEEESYKGLQKALGTYDAAKPPELQFDYAVAGPAHQVIVMDSRTRRSYSSEGEESAADLLGIDEIKRQIGARIRVQSAVQSLTVLVSPAPVIGHPFHEWVVNWGGTIGLATTVDREAWLVPHRRACFEELLRTLVPGRRVLILSGDVHYSFSCSLRYWDERTQPEGRAAIVQLVGSSLKNQEWKQAGLAALQPPQPLVFFGWPGSGDHISSGSKWGSKSIYVAGTPAVHGLKADERLVTPPAWRYSILLLNDSRSFPYRGGPVPLISTPTNFLATQRARAQEHLRRAGHDQMRTVVPGNNVATIRFAATPAGAVNPMLLVEHSLWYCLPDDSDDAAKPYTVHWGSLTPPTQSEAKPDSIDAMTSGPVDASLWADLLSFRPTPELQQLVAGRQMQFQPIESGWGEDINLDHYSIRVRDMPTINGVKHTPTSLLSHIRQHLNDFIDPDYAEFRPFDDNVDGKLWRTAAPYGCAIDIDMRVGGFPVEDGVVVVTDFAEDHWIFSTVYCERDAWHPVSGNRRFDYVADGDTWVFSTRGADRIGNAALLFGAAKVFGGAHGLWCSFQEAVELFVNQNGGVAVRETPIWRRVIWSVVKAGYHRPTREWIK